MSKIFGLLLLTRGVEPWVLNATFQLGAFFFFAGLVALPNGMIWERAMTAYVTFAICAHATAVVWLLMVYVPVAARFFLS